MDMPGIVNTYFDADRRNDADALLKTFAVEAVVEDEGRSPSRRRRNPRLVGGCEEGDPIPCRTRRNPRLTATRHSSGRG